jgi:hypothetical protein
LRILFFDSGIPLVPFPARFNPELIVQLVRPGGDVADRVFQPVEKFDSLLNARQVIHSPS